VTVTRPKGPAQRPHDHSNRVVRVSERNNVDAANPSIDVVRYTPTHRFGAECNDSARRPSLRLRAATAELMYSPCSSLHAQCALPSSCVTFYSSLCSRYSGVKSAEPKPMSYPEAMAVSPILKSPSISNDAPTWRSTATASAAAAVE
jgi:hypothetical protein